MRSLTGSGYVTVSEAARLTRTSRTGVLRLADLGQLPKFRRADGFVVFRLVDVLNIAGEESDAR